MSPKRGPNLNPANCRVLLRGQQHAFCGVDPLVELEEQEEAMGIDFKLQPPLVESLRDSLQ